VRLQHRLISSLRSGAAASREPAADERASRPDRSGAIALDPLAALIDGVGVGVGVKQD
jgi:hypothetical protein